MMQPLDATKLEPTGQHLIEASAGTGKTHNIALLFLRLLLERQFTVRQVAVVTFSEAATQELCGRLRRQLVEAIACLDGSSAGSRPDLDAILRRYREDEVSRVRAQALLHAALIGFDEARISTLHGLCRQLLTEHAFETGLSLFELDDIAGKEMTREQVRDFWRLRVILAPDEAIGSVLRRWKTPDDLASELIRSQVLALPMDRIDPSDVEDWVARERAATGEHEIRWNELRKSGGVDRALEQLQQAIGSKHFKSAEDSPLGPEQVRRCRAACAGDARHFDAEALTALRASSLDQQMSANAKKAAWNPPAELAEVSEVVEAFAQAQELLQSALLARFMREAIEFVRGRLAEHRSRVRRFGFDDLIGQLHEKLHGDSAKTLALAIASEIPAILVDEFQDTDPLQYAILHRIHAARADSVLLLIGDPKQAIYRFRGGDIYTYHCAARDAGNNQHTLLENWRADARLIAATNAVFSGVDDSFMVDFIRFQPARFPAAKGKPESWLATESPLTLWRIPDCVTDKGTKPWTVPDFNARVLGEVAASIQALLREAEQKRKQPPSIAVLVQTNRQAEETAELLGQWQIACDYVSTESVLLSEQATELQYLLAALDAPSDASRVRAALATELLGRNLRDLLESRDDLQRWELELGVIAELRQTWLTEGPYASLSRCIRQAAERLLPRWDGPRVITNFLHLADLLQLESARRSSPKDLLHWLGQRRIEAEQGSGMHASEQLRATDEAAPVQVRTIHGSKGLQYDVVFAPFAMGVRSKAGSKKNGPADESVAWHAEDELRIDTGGSDWLLHARAHGHEQFAESLRLAYVAITRARHRVYLAWAYANTGKNVDSLSGPFAWLWFREPHMRSPDELEFLKQQLDRFDGHLDALVKRSGQSIRVQILDPNAPEPTPAVSAGMKPALLPAKFRGSIERRLQTLSYSRLFGGSQHAPLADRDDNEDEAMQAFAGAVEDPVPRKPSGAEFGTCVHRILEKIPFADLASAQVSDELARIASDHGYAEGDHDVIATMVRNCVRTELLTGSGFRLMHLEPSESLTELEFLFPLGAARLGDLEEILARHPVYTRDAGELQVRRSSVLGLMTGFIDLVARWQGRYYVLDYKTNLLGASRADYAHEHLPAAIRGNDYDLQYLVYLVALQRFLRLRLGAEYDYECHMGGALYLFLRGMREGDGAGIHHDRPPAELIDALDGWFTGQLK